VQCIGDAASHVVPIVIGAVEPTLDVWAALAERGFMVGAVRPPTVPMGASRLRVTVSAVHTAEQIAGLVRAIGDALAEHGAESA
jgi:8-amino-7-oxononanoate synthase